MKTTFKLLAILSTCFLILGCKPDNLDITIYTTDIEVAQSGGIINIPVIAKFSLPGDDEEGDLSRAADIAKKYLPEDSEVKTTDGQFGKILVVDTKIPMGSLSMVQELSKGNTGLVFLGVDDNGQVSIEKNDDLKKRLELELKDINFMLGFELPANNTNIRVISDSRNPTSVSAQSVWENDIPHLNFSKALERREEAEIRFKGSEDSVYSQIPISFRVTSPE
jgi:hypothetical protein